MNVFTKFLDLVKQPPPITVGTSEGARTDVLDPRDPSKTLQTITQPSREQQNPNKFSATTRGPGQTTTIYDQRQGTYTETGSAPTEKVQSFLALAKAAQIVPGSDRFKQLAEGLAAESLIEYKEIRGGPEDAVTGYYVIDKSRPGHPMHMIPMPSSQGPAPVPGSKVDSTGAPRGTPDPQPQPSMTGNVGAGPTGMFAATGAGASFQRGVGWIAETMTPKAQTPESRQMDQNVADANAFYKAAQTLAVTDNRGSLGMPKAVLEAVGRLSLDPEAWFSSPETKKLSDAIVMRTNLENDYYKSYAIWQAGPGQYSKDARKKAEGRVEAYKSVLETMPTVDQMKQRLEEYSSGAVPGGMVGAVAPAARSMKEMFTEGVPAAIGEAKKALGGKDQQAPVQQAPAQPSQQSPMGGRNITPERLEAAIPKMTEAQIGQLDPQMVKDNPRLQAAYVARIRQLIDERRDPRKNVAPGRPVVGAPRPKGPFIDTGD